MAEAKRTDDKEEAARRQTKPRDAGVEVLRAFTALVETHRYYGSVVATSRECLQLQQEKLPELFDCEKDADTACCTAPSLVLGTPAQQGTTNNNTTTTSASSTPTASLTHTAQQRMDIPMSFTKGRITELPLHLLEGCTKIFQVLWKTRLQFMATTLTGPKLGVLDQAPLHPSAVVTLIRCLDPVPTKEEGAKLVLPIILSLVMDWKLQDDTTSTIRMEFPGILIGKLSTITTKTSSCSLHHVEIDLQSGAMLKSMTEQLKTFADKVLMVGWVTQTKQRIMSRLMPRDTGNDDDDNNDDYGEDVEMGEGSYNHAAAAASTKTPLQALFSSADQPTEGSSSSRQDANAVTATMTATTTSPQSSSSGGGGGGRNNLSVLSAAADQLQRADEASRIEESPAKKQKKNTDDVHGVPGVPL